MGIYSNSPTMTWISLTGISVAKGDEVFIVKDFKTNLKYIYWDYTNPYVFTATNVIKDRNTNLFQVAINDKGSFIEVPQEDIIVSYDGNSEQALSEHVWGLHEKADEFTNKFVSVEQNIDGITTTVGEHTEQMGLLEENISEVDQKADSINLSVQETKKEFNDNKDMMNLRENVNLSIINLNSALGVYKSLLNDYFKDSIISADEKVQIQANNDILTEKKNIMLSEMDKVIALMQEQENQTNVDTINRDKQLLETSITNLINLINTSISDNTIVPSEITTVINAFAKSNLDINDIKNSLDNMIFLGVGGKLSEELASINIKSDEIKLSVSSLEQNTDSKLNDFKDAVNKQFEDIDGALDDLETDINTSFLDGVLSESEKISLKRNLEILANEKNEADSEYNIVYINSDLVGSAKAELKTAYDSYTQKYNSLVSTLNNIISKSTNITEQDKINISNVTNSYRTALGTLSNKISKAVDSISSKKKNDAINSSNTYANTIKDSLSKEISDVNSSLTDLTTEMNGAFKDGIVDEIEIKTISERIIQLDKEKLDLDKQYNAIYTNTNLTETAKTNLYNAKTDYTSKHTVLKTAINNAIADKSITSAEISDINTKTTNYNNALSLLSQRFAEAVDNISSSKTETVDKKYSEILLTENGIVSKVGKIETTVNNQGTTINKHESSINQMATSIESKVSAGDIASSINQTAQSVKIKASKIDLDGYATFTNLETEGQTNIHGGNIKTGTIYVDQLNSNNPNPIIRLFGDCSVDATLKNEIGQGNSIRLKADRENYIKVQPTGYKEDGTYIGAHTAIYSGFYPNHEVMIFQGNAHWGKIHTTQGILSMHGNGVYYGWNGTTSDSKLATTSEVNSVSTVANNASSNASRALSSANSAYNLANSKLSANSSTYVITGSHDPYSSDKYNLGYSGARWNQCSAKYGYFTNTYSLAIDNPVSTINDISLDNVIDDVIIESPNIITMSDEMNGKLVINVNALKENKNGHLFVSEDDSGRVVINESSLLALALQEIKNLKEKVKKTEKLESKVLKLTEDISNLTEVINTLTYKIE